MEKRPYNNSSLFHTNWNRWAPILITLFISTHLFIFAGFQRMGVALFIFCYLLVGILLLSHYARKVGMPATWQRTAKAMRTLDLEVYAILRCLYSRFFSSLPQRKSPGRPAILFLHGMLGDGQNGHFLLKNLAGFGSVHTLDMGTDNNLAYQISYEQEIVRCAGVVTRKIEQIMMETGQKEIILIGHSRGGVVANYLATTRSDIPLVITLGTPLQYPQRDDHVAHFINRLNEKLARHSETRFLHLFAEGDIVTSTESSFPIRAHHRERFKIAHHGHLSLLYSEEVVEKIIDELSV